MYRNIEPYNLQDERMLLGESYIKSLITKYDCLIQSYTIGFISNFKYIGKNVTYNYHDKSDYNYILELYNSRLVIQPITTVYMDRNIPHISKQVSKIGLLYVGGDFSYNAICGIDISNIVCAGRKKDCCASRLYRVLLNKKG
jgi:hypothetical protein